MFLLQLDHFGRAETSVDIGLGSSARLLNSEEKWVAWEFNSHDFVFE
jgi:hypothetical protein